MSSVYFLLDGAYNETNLRNTPSQYQDMKNPCIPSYPFLSDFSHDKIDTRPLETDYQNMNKSYPVKACPYCSFYQGT